DRRAKGFGAFVFFGAEQGANRIANEMSRLRLEASLANAPVINNRPKTANQKKQLDNYLYVQIEKSIELRERVQRAKGAKQSSSNGFGILDVGATSGIMGVEAAENLRDIIHEQTGKNINMDVSQETAFIFGDGNARACTAPQGDA
ncbi:unnamed protein product, partial [Prorocentrum cordatum]